MPRPEILYLIDELWSSKGGTEQNLTWLLRTIPDDKFGKHFIVFSRLRTEDAAIREQNPLVLGERLGTGPRTWCKRLRFVARYIREHGIDLVHAFGPMAELAAVLAVRLAGRGTVLGNRRDCGYDRRAKYRWIYWLARKLGTRYIANSEAARQAAYRNNQTPLDSIRVIRNPISRERVEQGLARPVRRDELPPGEPIVGMVASVRPIKDYETLIRAAKIVTKKYPDAMFLCIGEQEPPEYTAELKRLAETEGVASSFVWFGPIDNPIRILPLFDVAVLSTHSESFSNALLEYAVMERPIVVSDVGGLHEIVDDGRTGFLVPPGDAAALAGSVLRLLDDPGLARSLGREAGLFVSEKYDQRKIVAQYEDAYRETTGKTDEKEDA